MHLARGGRSVEVIEQSAAAHHKVCGEFLSREAVAYLDALGLDLRPLGAAPIHGVRLAARRRIAACDLPFHALSLTRRRLDEALLALAAQSGAKVVRGQRVDALTQTNGTQADPMWVAQLAGGERHSAPAVFLATGKHDVAGHRRAPGAQNTLIAFKMYFRLAVAQQRALHGWVELFLFPGGYAGLQLTEDNEANLCLLVERTAFAACRRQWPALLTHLLRSCDSLAERLDAAEPLLAKPLALSSIPYGLLVESTQPGLWRLGDQAAVIPSFSGDGISIALHSARLAAGMYLRNEPSAKFARLLSGELRNSVQLATTLSRLMIAMPVLAHAAQLWPAMLSHLATRTRIPTAAWSSAVLGVRP
jgi:menaquinone-9 beta-reductase